MKKRKHKKKAKPNTKKTITPFQKKKKKIRHWVIRMVRFKNNFFKSKIHNVF